MLPTKLTFFRHHALTYLYNVSPRYKSHHLPNPTSTSQESCPGCLLSIRHSTLARQTARNHPISSRPHNVPTNASTFPSVLLYFAHHKVMALVQPLPSYSSISRASHLTPCSFFQPILSTVKETSDLLISATALGSETMILIKAHSRLLQITGHHILESSTNTLTYPQLPQRLLRKSWPFLSLFLK